MSTTFLTKYKVIHKIGEGTFSEVLKCQDRTSGISYAGKRLKKIYSSINEILECPEVIAMRKISWHPNILYMIESHYDPLPGKVTLIFELMEMSLYDLIRSRKGAKMFEPRVKLYVYQLLKGLDHLHKHGIFHRDIKPENILVKGILVKLADLGSIRGIYSKPPYTEYISTRWYRSPECLLTTGFYGPKMDIWALGCVYYELLELKPLFPGSSEVDQIFKIHEILGTPSSRLVAKFRRHKSKNCDYFFSNKSGTGLMNLLPFVSEYGKEVLKMMLIYDPENRSSIKRLLEHRYFNELRECDPEMLTANSQHSTSSPKNSELKNPILLSYLTSEKRRRCKPLTSKELSNVEEMTPKPPRIVESNSTPNARQNPLGTSSAFKTVISEIIHSSIAIVPEGRRNLQERCWRRSVYSTKTEIIRETPRRNTRLPNIKYNSTNKIQDNGDVVGRSNPQRIQGSFSSHLSLRYKNPYPSSGHTAAENPHHFTFLPKIVQKPDRQKPAAANIFACQQIIDSEGIKRKKQLPTIIESQKQIVGTSSPNLKSPAKKMAKHESSTSSSSKHILAKKSLGDNRATRGK